jgi:hypothetical protein
MAPMTVTTSVGRDKEVRTFTHGWRGHKMVQSLWKVVWQSFKQLNLVLHHDPGIPLPKWKHSLKTLHTSICISFRCNNQKSRNNPDIHQSMSRKINVLQCCNGVLFNHKKEQSPESCCNENQSWKPYPDRMSPIVWLHLHEMSRISQSMGKESWLVIAWGWGAGTRKF